MRVQQEDDMTRFGKLLTIAGGLTLTATAAFAAAPPRSDQAYCTALSDLYVRYVGHDEDNSNNLLYLRGSLDGQVAVAQCRQGNTAAAIPVLERKLTDQKFTLPARG
jgi:hypothetical protein